MRKLFFFTALTFVVIAYFAGGKKIISGHSGKVPPSAARAIAYARNQLGKAYVWGATGPYTFDCSGLTFRAWGLPWSQRTSQEQWSTETHVSHPRPGDLVFFQGLLVGGESPPGHVGIVIGKNKMIDAYASGTQVRIESFGVAGSAPGLETVWGYSRP